MSSQELDLVCHHTLETLTLAHGCPAAPRSRRWARAIVGGSVSEAVEPTSDSLLTSRRTSCRHRDPRGTRRAVPGDVTSQICADSVCTFSRSGHSAAKRRM
jgi:hypothetical protein